MPLSIEVRGLDGVSLLSPSDPEFDTLAAPLLGRATALVLRLKPFLVLVQNESARTVVAFSKTLRITHAAGRVGTLQDQNIFPHVVCGDTVSGLDAPGIAPGERRIDGHGVVLYGWGNLDPYFDQSCRSSSSRRIGRWLMPRCCRSSWTPSSSTMAR